MAVASARASAGRGEGPIALVLTVRPIASPCPWRGGRSRRAGGAGAGRDRVEAAGAWSELARSPFVTCLALALTGFGPQQVVFGMAFALYAVVAFRVSWFREATDWFTVGRVDGRIMALGSAFAAVSGATLLLWYVTALFLWPIPSGRSSPIGRSGC